MEMGARIWRLAPWCAQAAAIAPCGAGMVSGGGGQGLNKASSRLAIVAAGSCLLVQRQARPIEELAPTGS